MTARHVQQQPDLRVNQEGSSRRDAYLSVSTLAHQARKLCLDLDFDISGSRCRKLVRRFIDEGRSDIDFRTWFLSYADPTGELAVRNVEREQRAR